MEKRTSKLIKFIKNNKLITISALIFIMCVSLNFILIYNFMRVLAMAK